MTTGLVTAAVGAAAFWDARDLTMFGENSVPGPGFFPKILAGLLVVLGLILAGIALREKEPEPVEADGRRRRRAHPQRQDPRGGRPDRVRDLRAPGGVIGYVPAMVLLVLVVLTASNGAAISAASSPHC